MKTKLSTIAIALLATLICTPSPASANDNKIQEIKDRGSLRVCYAQSNPNQVKNPTSNAWEGFNVDAGRNLAETMEVTFEAIDATWGTLIPNLQANKCDIAMVDMFVTPQRAQVVLFAEPWGRLGMEVIVHANSDLTDYEQLNSADLTFVSNSGSANEEAAKRYFPNAQHKAVVADSPATQFLEVAGKRGDAMITDQVNIDKFLKENPQIPVRRLGPAPINVQGFAYAIPDGEYHFQQFVNAWQNRTLSSGLKAQWWQQWYGEPIPERAQ